MKKSEPDLVIRTLASLADSATAPARAIVEVLGGRGLTSGTAKDLIGEVAGEIRDLAIEKADGKE